MKQPTWPRLTATATAFALVAATGLTLAAAPATAVAPQQAPVATEVSSQLQQSAETTNLPNAIPIDRSLYFYDIQPLVVGEKHAIGNHVRNSYLLVAGAQGGGRDFPGVPEGHSEGAPGEVVIFNMTTQARNTEIQLAPSGTGDQPHPSNGYLGTADGEQGGGCMRGPRLPAQNLASGATLSSETFAPTGAGGSSCVYAAPGYGEQMNDYYGAHGGAGLAGMPADTYPAHPSLHTVRAGRLLAVHEEWTNLGPGRAEIIKVSEKRSLNISASASEFTPGVSGDIAVSLQSGDSEEAGTISGTLRVFDAQYAEIYSTQVSELGTLSVPFLTQYRGAHNLRIEFTSDALGEYRHTTKDITVQAEGLISATLSATTDRGQTLVTPTLVTYNGKFDQPLDITVRENGAIKVVKEATKISEQPLKHEPVTFDLDPGKQYEISIETATTDRYKSITTSTSLRVSDLYRELQVQALGTPKPTNPSRARACINHSAQELTPTGGIKAFSGGVLIAETGSACAEIELPAVGYGESRTFSFVYGGDHFYQRTTATYTVNFEGVEPTPTPTPKPTPTPTPKPTQSAGVGGSSVEAPKPFTVAVSGMPRVGVKLKAKTASDSGITGKKYRWYANGKAIKGATKSTYTVRTKDIGKRLTVRVTAKRANSTISATSSKTAKAGKSRATLSFQKAPKTVFRPKQISVKVRLRAPGVSKAGGKLTIKSGKASTTRTIKKADTYTLKLSSKNLRKGKNKIQISFKPTKTAAKWLTAPRSQSVTLRVR